MPATRLLRAIIMTTALTAASATARAQAIDVVFVAPDTFDLRNAYVQTQSARAFYLNEIRRYIEREAAKRLPFEAALRVRITGIALAGTYYATRPALTNVRIIQDVTPARIDLDFTVTSRTGAVLVANRRELRTTGYPTGPNVDANDPLRYVKALIDEWLSEDLSLGR